MERLREELSDTLTRTGSLPSSQDTLSPLVQSVIEGASVTQDFSSLSSEDLGAALEGSVQSDGPIIGNRVVSSVSADSIRLAHINGPANHAGSQSEDTASHVTASQPTVYRASLAGTDFEGTEGRETVQEFRNESTHQHLPERADDAELNPGFAGSPDVDSNTPPTASLTKSFLQTEVDLESAWEHVNQELRRRIDPQIYAAWIRSLKLASVDLNSANRSSALGVASLQPGLFQTNARATILTPNKFCCEHVSNNYGGIIVEILSDVLGVKSLELHFAVSVTGSSLALRASTEETPATSDDAGDSSTKKSNRNGLLQALSGKSNGHHLPQQITRDSDNKSPSLANTVDSALKGISRSELERTSNETALKSDKQRTVPRKAPRFNDTNGTNINPKYNFSNFVVGTCNQFAHAVSLQVANELGSNYNPLFIYGGVGLGKTHLANAIGNASRRRNKKVLLCSSESFLSELISSLRNNSMSQFKSKFRSLDVLVIDDIQFIIGKERTQEEFFHTFNDLYNRQKQIIITSDKIPQELVGLEERLRTRFSSGIAVDLQKPDFETRVAILIKKAQLSGLDLPQGVARLVAERIDTNVRELEGALNRLQALSALRNCELTESVADEVLRSLAPQRKKEVTTDLVKRVVAERFNVSVHDIVGKRRTHNIALARQVAMFLCRELTTCSYPELGALFGGRDHSTVIHARKVVAERIEKDDSFRTNVKEIEFSILN